MSRQCRLVVLAGSLFVVLLITLAPRKPTVSFASELYERITWGMHRDELLALMEVPPGDYGRKNFFGEDRYYGSLGGLQTKTEAAYQLSWKSDTAIIEVWFGPDDRVMRACYWTALPQRGLISRFVDWLNKTIPISKSGK
jgi:hypothetical protein